MYSDYAALLDNLNLSRYNHLGCHPALFPASHIPRQFLHLYKYDDKSYAEVCKIEYVPTDAVFLMSATSEVKGEYMQH